MRSATIEFCCLTAVAMSTMLWLCQRYYVSDVTFHALLDNTRSERCTPWPRVAQRGLIRDQDSSTCLILGAALSCASRNPLADPFRSPLTYAQETSIDTAPIALRFPKDQKEQTKSTPDSLSVSVGCITLNDAKKSSSGSFEVRLYLPATRGAIKKWHFPYFI